MPSLNRRVSDLLVVGVTSADIAPGAVTFADVGTIYTSNLTEDTNLFFSNTRATVAVAAGSAANALLFVNAAGVLSNTSSLVWTGSNLGVGTATPRLNTANVMAGLTTLTVYNVASEGGGIELATGSSTATSVAGRLTFTSGANNNGFRTLAWIDSLIQGSTAGNQGGSLRFGVKPDNGTAAIALTIDSTGNIGIGKTPVFKLDVSADASINGVRIGLGAGAVSTNTAVGVSALAANTTGYYSTATGYNALTANTSGNENTASGFRSLYGNTTGSLNVGYGAFSLFSNTTASNNTAVGYQAGYSNTTGTWISAIGFQAGYSATSGPNLFLGFQAGYNTTSGGNNEAIGSYRALYSNTTGNSNIAIGRDALYNNTTASNNTAVGYQAGYSNTTGYNNAAVGNQAFYYNTTGALNTAMGDSSLISNTTGNSNTAVGRSALGSNTTASNNTAVGYQSSYSNVTGSNRTSVGSGSAYYATGANTTAIGAGAGFTITTGANNTAVGSVAMYGNTVTGSNNTAVGAGDGAFDSPLRYLTSGDSNVALGNGALSNNTTGSYGVAVGRAALYFNTTASNNTAVGYQAGYNNTTGGDNVAIGQGALYSNTTGYRQVAIGNTSLASVTTNANNSVAVGWRAGANVTTGGVTAVGYYTCQSVTTGISNVGVGSNTNGSTTGSYNVTVGDLCCGSGAGNYNTAIGHQVLYAMGNTASGNTGVGFQALYYNGNTASISGNTAVGQSALSNLTGNFNTAIGYNSGSSITSGSKNTILGSYNGNQGGLDIRTASNYIVLSDGDGNPRFGSDNTGKLNSNPGSTNGYSGASTFYSWNNEKSRGASTALEYKIGFNNSAYSGYNAEYESAVELYQVASTGSTLTIPITNQGGVWIAHQIRIRGVAANFNQTSNLAFTADISLATATSASGFAESHTGNISSIAMSGTNIVITFTTAYAQTTSSQQVGGVIVYIEHLARNLMGAPIVWSSIAMN